MRTLLVTVAAAALAAACGGAPSRPGHQDRTTPAVIKLTKRQACELLLHDVARNAGTADVATLRQIADHVTAPRVAADARTAVRDFDHTGSALVALGLLRADCAEAGVRIPGP